MKITGNFKEWAVTQSLLAKILELSIPRINQLIDEEIVVRDENSKSGAVLLIDSLKNYYGSKRSNEDNGGTVNFWKERALNEKAKREINQIKLRKMTGELYTAATVENAFADVLTILRGNLLALPAKFALQLENKSRAEIHAVLTEEINFLLNNVADFDLSTLAESEIENEDETETD